jgi:type II secretory pathway component PulF
VHGLKVSVAVELVLLLRLEVARLIQVLEDAKLVKLPQMLLALAVKRFGMLIEPVMIMVTGGIVGFVYVAFFMALFAIAGTN